MNIETWAFTSRLLLGYTHQMSSWRHIAYWSTVSIGSWYMLSNWYCQAASWLPLWNWTLNRAVNKCSIAAGWAFYDGSQVVELVAGACFQWISQVAAVSFR